MYILKKRVRFYETDGMCVVYHGNYLKWFEEARVEYMREGGVCLNDLLNEGIVFPVVEIHVKYLMKTYLREADRAKLVFEYEVVREATGEILTTGKSVGTYTKAATGKIARMSPERLAKLIEISKEDRRNG